jgi:hypothetical protein
MSVGLGYSQKGSESKRMAISRRTSEASRQGKKLNKQLFHVWGTDSCGGYQRFRVTVLKQRLTRYGIPALST